MIRTGPTSGPSGNTADYRWVFVERVHQLIQRGYGRLTPSTLREEEEPAITGILVEAIEEVLDGPRSEDWTDFFGIHDDPPVNDDCRRGKRRNRLDIKFVSSERRPRQLFSFEAKRLGQNHTAGTYLGADGLGCFLEGKYASDENDAGMLGYVQTGKPIAWGIKIGQALAAAPQKYAVLDSWREWKTANGPDYCYRSRHLRRSPQRGIEIYHTLLPFQ